MQRVQHSSPLYNKLITQYYNDNPDVPIEVQQSNLNQVEFVKEYNKYISEYAKRKKEALEEERLRKKLEFDELENSVRTREYVLHSPMFSIPLSNAESEELKEDKKRLEELAKESSMTDEEAYLDVVLNSNKEDMPQSVLEAALSQKQKERKWYLKSFLDLSESDNPAEWILGNIGKFIDRAAYYNPVSTAGLGVAAATNLAKFGIEHAIRSQQNADYTKDIEEEAKKIREEFYSYSDKARNKAFNERRKNLQTLLQDSLLNQISPQKKEEKQSDASREEIIYDTLTNPKTIEAAQAERWGERMYSNQVAPYWQWKIDAKYKFLENLNTALIGNYEGRIVRTKELSSLVDTFETYLDNNDEISRLQDRLSELQYIIRTGGSANPQYLELLGFDPNMPLGLQLTLLRAKIEQLQSENLKYADSIEKLESFVPSNIIDKLDTKLGATVGEALNKKFNKFVGLDISAPLFNDGDYIRYFLTGIDPNGSPAENRKAIARFRKAVENKNNEWSAGIEANKADLEKLRSEYLVSDYYNWMEQHVKGSIFNPDVWAYLVPGFLGSSQSSWLKQLPSTAVNLATMFFSGGTSSGWTLARGLAATQSMALGHSSGADENYAEVSENYKQRLRQLLLNEGLYEEFVSQGEKELKKLEIQPDKDDQFSTITQAMLQGQWSPSGKKAHKMRMIAADASMGSGSLFELDMRATTLDDFVNTTIMLTPFNSAVKDVRVLDKVIDKTANISIPTQLMLKGARNAASWSAEKYKSIKNIAKQFDDLGMFVQSVPNRILRKVVPNASTYRDVKKIGRAILSGYAGNVFSEEGQLIYRAIRHNIGDVLGRSVESAFAESIEEGKQYKHGLEYVAGELDEDSRRHWFNVDTFVKDASDGFQSAFVALGAPFGWEFTSDAEWVLNVKGGILGSIVQGGGTNVLNAVKPTISQAAMNRFVYRTALMEKAEVMDEYKKGILYSKRGTDGQAISQELQLAFDTFLKVNQQRKESGYSSIDEEWIKEQQKIANSVVQLANSLLALTAAKKNNIKVGSEDYHQMVSWMSMAARKMNDKNELFLQTANRITEEYEKIEAPFKINETLNAVVNDLDMQDIDTMGSAIVQREGDENNEETLSRVTSNWKNNVAQYAQVVAYQRLINSFLEAYDAGKYFGKSAESVKFILRRLLQKLDDKLDLWYDRTKDVKYNKAKRQNAMKMAERFTSLTTNKEDLVSAYRQQILASIDMDYYDAMLNTIIGDENKNKSVDENGVLSESTKTGLAIFKIHNVHDLIKAVNKTLEKDELLYWELEKDQLDKYLYDRDKALEQNRENNGVTFDESAEPVKPVKTPKSDKKEGVVSETSTRNDTVITKFTQYKKSKHGNLRRLHKGGLEIDLESVNEEDLKSVDKGAKIFLSELRDSNGSLEGTIFVKNKGSKEYEKREVKFKSDPRIRKVKKLYVSPTTTSKPGDRYTAEQQKTIDELNSNWEKQQSTVNWGENGETVRSGHDYFISDGSDVKMAKRVHTALDKQYLPTEEDKKEKRSRKKALRKLWDARDKRGFYNLAKQYIEEWSKKYPNAEKINLDRYWQQLKNHPEKVSDVIEAIVDMTFNTPASISIKAGNVFHDIAARFFGGSTKQLNYAEFSNLMDEATYNSIIEQLKKLKEKYDALGWFIDARPHVFYKEFVDSRTGKIVRIAGETDAIAVDKDGKKHIIDFKTSFQSFVDQIQNTLEGPKKVNSFKDIPTTSRDGSIPIMSKEQNYSEQLTMYSMLIGDVESIEIVPMKIGYYGHDDELQHISSMEIEANGTIALSFSNTVTQRFVSLEDEKALSLAWENNKPKIDKVAGLLITLINNSDQQTSEDGKALLDQFSILRSLNAKTISEGKSLFERFYTLVQNYYKLSNNAKQKEFHKDLEDAEAVNARRKMLQEMEGLGITWDDILESELSEKDRELNNVAATFNNTYRQVYTLVSEMVLGKYNVDPNAASAVYNIDPSKLTELAQLVSILKQSLIDLRTVSDIYFDLVNQDDVNAANKLLVYITSNFGIIGTEYKAASLLSPSPSNTAWYNYITTYKKSIESSIDISGSGKRLLEVTANPDFITNATFQYVRPNKRGPICVQVTYNGVTYTPVEIHNPDWAKNWMTDIVRALNKANRKPVRPSKVNRTFGRYKKGLKDTLLTKGLIAPKDLYDILYGSDDSNIGVVKNYAGQTVITSPSLKGGTKILYVFSNADQRPIEGTLQYLLRPAQNEVTNQALLQRIPIQLMSPNLSEGDADLVIDILTGKHNIQHLYGRAALQHEFFEEGTYKGLTCRQVLNMLIPTELFGKKGKSLLHLDFSDKYPYLVYVNGRVAGDELKVDQQGNPIIPQRVWDLRDPNATVNVGGVPMTFKLFLMQKVNKNISEEILSARLGNEDSYKQVDSPIKNVKKAVEKVGGTLRFGNSTLAFEKSDFVNPNTGDLNGISGLGWYIKNGFLVTDYEGIENALLNFNGSHPIIDDGDDRGQLANTKEERPIQPPVELKQKISTNPEDNDTPKIPKQGRRRGGLDYKQKSLAKTKSDRVKEAKQNIAKILKIDDAETESGLKIEELVANEVVAGAYIVGKCYSDCILIHNCAKPGVEYHEAFHRIAEILMTREERDRVYKLYKNKHKNSKNVVEDIADDFMEFMISDRPKVDIKLLKELKLIKLFKQIIDFVKFMHNIGGLRLYRIYSQIANGKYANVIADPKRVKEFEETYKNGLNFAVKGKELKTIVNSHMYDAACRSISTMLIAANNIDFLMTNVKDIKLDKQLLLDSEDYKYYSSQDNIGSKVLKELVEDSWDSIKDDIAAEISSKLLQVKKKEESDTQQTDPIADLYKQLAEQWGADFNDSTQTEPADGELYDDGANANSASISEHIHESYEFSQFSRVSPKVKFFFGRIYKSTRDEDGEKVDVLNELGLPEYVDAKRTFNTVLNACYHVRDYNELLSALKRLSEDNVIYETIYNRIEELVNQAYKDPNNINYDAEQLLTQISNAICANKMNFELIQVRDDEDGKVEYSKLKVDEEYNSREYRKEWSQLFTHGKGPLITTDENGNVVLKKGMTPYQLLGRALMLTSMSNAVVFGRLARLGLAYAFSDLGMQAYNTYLEKLKSGEEITGKDVSSLFYINVDGQPKIIDVTNAKDLHLCKQLFCQILYDFGILFNIDELNYMLREKYGSSGHLAMQEMFEDTSSSNKEGNVATFAKLIGGMIVYDQQTGKLGLNAGKETIAGVPSDTIYVRGRNSGFIGELARYKYLYKHSLDMLSEMVVGGNKYYTISEHNLLSDRTEDLNRAAVGQNIESIEILKSFSYNIISDPNTGKEIGSLVLKEINKSSKDGNSKLHLAFIPFSGMKTNHVGDVGQDYFLIVQRDDHLAKMYILQENGMISPTMSDKKRTGYLTGIVLPGIRWDKNLSDLILPHLQDGTVVASDDVLEQLLEYAMCERAAIGDCLVDIFGGQTSDGTELLPLDKSQYVENYHSGNTVEDSKGSHTIVQGARFSTLLGVYDEDGNYRPFNIVSETYTDNDGNTKSRYVDEKTNVQRADDLFFSPRMKSDYSYESIDEVRNRQKRMINKLLHKKLIDELLYLERLGIISIGDKSSDESILKSIKNIYLDNSVINRSFEGLLAQEDKSTTTRYIYDEELKQAVEIPSISSSELDQYMSMAVVSYVMDNMCKAIISKQEFERIFSGHPSFTKFEYEGGKLVDRSTDQHKRFGGIVSTGVTGNRALLNSRLHYTCAQVANEMIESPMIDDLERLMKRSQLVQTYADYLLSTKYAKQPSVIDEVKDKEHLLEILNIAKQKKNEEIEQELKKNAPEALYVAEQIYTSKVNSFRKDGKNKGIDVADGAAYISDEMCEILLRRAGSYDNKVADAFKILRDPSKTRDVYELARAYRTVLTTVIGTQKYTAYGFRSGDGLAIPYYDKLAFFPLFKSICTGRMAAIFEKMQQQSVDVLFTNSAVKLGGQGSIKIDWDSLNSGKQGDTRPTFKSSVWFNTYTQNLNDLRKQFNTDPNEDKEGLTMGTQMTKIVLSALRPGAIYYTLDGRTLSSYEILTEMMQSLNRLSDDGKKKIDEMFFTNGKFDLTKLSKVIQDELSRRGASKDLIDSFTVVDGKMKVSPAAQSNMHWIESILASVINKRIIDTNTAGNLFIQRSIWGMEGPTVIGDDLQGRYPKPLNNGNRLQMINEEGSMDCVISIDYFLPLLRKVKVKKTVTKIRKVPSTYKDKYGITRTDYSKMVDEKYDEETDELIPLSTQSFERQKQWLIDNGIISGIKTGETEWSNATADIVAYRIPTQAISSIHALRVVDVLPVVRDTIMLPSEFTKITGSDFDIDKLFLSGIWFEVEENGTVSRSTKPGDKHYHENLLIRDLIAVLINKDSKDGEPYNVLQLHGPIDDDTKLITDVIDEITSNKAKKEVMPYDDYTLSSETALKNEFITGKIGIGPFALNNNNHVLTTLYGIEFADDGKSILSRNKLLSLHDYQDRDGKSILSWLSGLINIHVDVAKNAKPVVEGNINPFTYNLINLLIRVGLGKTTFYFTTQPIMKELAKHVADAKGLVGVDNTISTYRIAKLAEESYIKSLIEQYIGLQYKNYNEAIKELESNFKGYGISINDAIDTLLQKGNNILKESSQAEEDISSTKIINYEFDSKKGKFYIDHRQLQLLVYLAYKQFEPYADALSKLVKYSKIDTKKQGVTFVEQELYEIGYNDVFYDKRGTNKYFVGLDAMNTHSYIHTKTSNALYSYFGIIKQIIFEATPIARYILDSVLYSTGNFDTLNIKLIKLVYNSIIQQIKSDFFNQYASRNGIDIKGLVSGNNTICDRLEDLKQSIAIDPRYSDLIDQYGEITNPLLRSLVTSISYSSDPEQLAEYGKKHHGLSETYETAKFIRLLNFADDENLDLDALTFAWQELLTDERPELRQFAKDLIVYSFITTGDVGGAKNLFRYVPSSWKLDNSSGKSYNDFMLEKLDEFNRKGGNIDESAFDIEDIILNNWRDNQLVPVKKAVVDGTLQWTAISVKDSDQNIPYHDAPLIITNIAINKQGLFETHKLPNYFKIQRNNNLPDSHTKKYAIYKRVGSGMKAVEDGEGNIRLIPYDIYSIVDPKGNTFTHNHKILEYGRNDGNLTEFSHQFGLSGIGKMADGSIQTYQDLVEFYQRLRSNPQYRELMQLLGQIDPKTSQYTELMEDISRYNTEVATVVSEQEYTRELVENDSDVLYIFTDNTDRDSGKGVVDPESSYALEFANGRTIHYPNATTAQIRGLENAAPISTQRWYHEGAKGSKGRWTENDFEEFKQVIDKEVAYISRLLNEGNYHVVVLPKGGLFGSKDGISNIQSLPKFVQYIATKLLEIGIDVKVPNNIEEFNSDRTAAQNTYEVPSNNNLSGSETLINIYAGTRENADLSNFAERPFKFTPVDYNYGVFNPNQIKSATDNEGPTPYEGTFSIENDDIYYQILTDSEYSEIIEELELSRDSTDSFIYNFVTKVLRVKPNYKVDENSSDSAWYSYFSTNVDPLYTNGERTEKLIRKIFGYDANIVFNDRQSLIESINEELNHWVENLKNMIENPLDLSDFYKKRRLILLRIKDLNRYNKGKLSLTGAELQQVQNYIDELNSKASKYSKLTESQRIGYEIVKLRKELLSLEQQIQSLIFKRHSIIVSAKNRLVAINTIDNIQDLIRNRILLEYEAYQPKDDFINQKVLPFENLIKKIKKATLSNNYEHRTDDLINLDQQTDITYDELYKIVTKKHHEFANLIELFRSANPNLKIKIGGAPETLLSGVVPGKFHPKSNTLTLYNGCDVYTIIHELAHSATFFGIFGKSKKYEEFSKKIEMFMNYVRKYISDNKLNPRLFSPFTIKGASFPADIYGFTNESEFIAELYGNPSFLDLLDSIPPMNKKEFNSLLQEFIHTIIEFFNNLLGKNRIHKSALDLAKELGLISIKLQKDHIEDIYRQLHDIDNDNFNNQLNNFLYETESKDIRFDLFDDNKQLLLVLKNLGQKLMNKCKG